MDPDPYDTVRYYIELSVNDPTFSGVQGIPTGIDNFYTPISDLLDHVTYYWRVSAGGYQGFPPALVDGAVTTSSVFLLRLDTFNIPPQDFSLLAPDDNSVFNLAAVTVEALPGSPGTPGSPWGPT